MMHGIDYTRQNVAGWLLSEKLDGCRGFWDGYDLWSRGGRLIAVPAYLRERLPEGIMLDGEVYAGRGTFERARCAVQYGRWDETIAFSAFDAPDAGGPFAERYAFLKHILPDRGLVHYVEHRPCSGLDEAVDFMLAIHARKGEGVILRDPQNIYRPGRTDGLLKLKTIPEVMYAHDAVSSLRKAHQPRIHARKG